MNSRRRRETDGERGCRAALNKNDLRRVHGDLVVRSTRRGLSEGDVLGSRRAIRLATLAVAGGLLAENHQVHQLSVGARKDDFLAPAGELLARAQAAGVVRPDVDAADLSPIMRMMRSLVVTPDDYRSADWQRYLALMLHTPPTTRA